MFVASVVIQAGPDVWKGCRAATGPALALFGCTVRVVRPRGRGAGGDTRRAGRTRTEEAVGLSGGSLLDSNLEGRCHDVYVEIEEVQK